MSTKQDISALLDGELETGDADLAIDALRRNPELQRVWDAYHLVGDTLRDGPDGFGYSGDSGYYPDLSAKVMARLKQEPALLAPASAAALRRKTQPAPLRFALPLAAGIMGIAAVGWVALSLNAPEAALTAKAPAPDGAARLVAAAAPPAGALKEYLVAHQAHSPSGGIPGVAPYVRSVSEIRQGSRP
ncbi:MAG: sigma-E factor negative regulatory protein [Zoogloeaceae bacterium]|jgi:sigma-E factor negative regulatory protein RseA|nr:sigma-E factor negative regulatory protein [Zoogloeaceae bacterium]